MTSVEPLAYAIDPPEVSGAGEIGVQLVVTNQTEEPASNLCLEVSTDTNRLRVLGKYTFSGILLAPHGSIRLPLRLRGTPGPGKLKLHSISLRLNGRPERLNEVQLNLQVAAPVVAPRVRQAPPESPIRQHSHEPLCVFVSYSHMDELLRSELAKHLKPLVHEKLILPWDDHKILPGDIFATEIDKALDCADIILLLISPDFVNSEYCYGKEMLRALERHELAKARVIPIIARPVDWHSAPFGSLKALPTDGRPIVSWPNQDEAFVNVVKGIRLAIEHQRLTKPDIK